MTERTVCNKITMCILYILKILLHAVYLISIYIEENRNTDINFILGGTDE